MRHILYFFPILLLISEQVTAHSSSKSGRFLQATNNVQDAGKEWVLLEDYLGETDGERSGLGFSVATSLDGQITAYGSPYKDINKGAVGVYKYDSKKGWVQMGKDIKGSNRDNYFGQDVALSYNGQILVASAPRAFGDKGYVRVFRFDSPTNSWEQIGEDIEGKESLEELGFSVAISQNGNYVALGAPNNPHSAGSVRVYEYKNNEWKQVGSDIIHENASRDEFGHSVDILEDGDVFVAIGAPSELDSKGSAGIFMLNPGTREWGQFGGYINGNVKGTNFGRSVSLAYNKNLLILAVGFPGPGIDSTSTILSGAEVYSINRDDEIFDYYGQMIYPSEKDDNTGYKVSLSEDGQMLALSSPGYGRENGMIRVYKYDINEGKQGKYKQFGDVIVGDDYAELGFSLSLSRDGEVVTTGSPERDYVVTYLSPGSSKKVSFVCYLMNHFDVCHAHYTLFL